jgi:predicted hydrocarbon binding protein
MRHARPKIRTPSGGSRVILRWKTGGVEIDLRGSIFCAVREPVREPLCVFYASAIDRLMHLFQLPVELRTDRCRGTGGSQCVMSLSVRPAVAGA